jgi:hypothetical protein
MDRFLEKTIFPNFQTDKIINQYRTFSQINTGNLNSYFFGFTLIYSLTKGNAQALYILCEILEKYLDDNVIKEFYGKLFKCKILGKRLVYIYENECAPIHNFIRNSFNNKDFKKCLAGQQFEFSEITFL